MYLYILLEVVFFTLLQKSGN